MANQNNKCPFSDSATCRKDDDCDNCPIYLAFIGADDDDLEDIFNDDFISSTDPSVSDFNPN